MKYLNFKNKLLTSFVIMSFGIFGIAQANDDVYGPFPVTLKGYSGYCTNTVSYSGQIARHAQHDSLLSLIHI